jgi:YVTN family beta-propeller protein
MNAAVRQSLQAIGWIAVVICFWHAERSPVVSAAERLRSAGEQNSSTPAAQESSPLNFETYRSRIEPIFLKKRQGDVRCVDCHSVMKTRLHLQPLVAGNSSWSEEQSRLNFEAVSSLVTPGEPMKSKLLLHPLAPEAGGDPAHTGGKFWASRNDAEWQVIADWVGNGGAATANSPARTASAAEAQSFQGYKEIVEPIFLKQRGELARCYSCHSDGNKILKLERLKPGSSGWSEEQSQHNFQAVLQVVVPGEPSSSRLLMHPLSPEQGGEAFHSGGRQFATVNDPDWMAIAQWIKTLKPHGQTSGTPKMRLYVTNSAGNTVDVFDPATNNLIQTIEGIELPHGVAFSADGSRVYISNESESVMDVVDANSGQITQKVALSGRPNNLCVSKDGKRVYVGIRSGSGELAIIDTDTLKQVKSIPVHGGIHNVYVTPDGRYAVAGSLESKLMTAIDLQTDQIAWEVNLGSGVRPMAMETNPDGSTRRVFAQLSGFNGFAIVDFVKRAEVGRVKLPDKPGGYGVKEGRLGTPSHGIGVAPDGKSLWVASTAANALFEYALPSLDLLGYTALPEVQSIGGPTGSVPEWITFTPDSKTIFVSNSGARSVSAVDVTTRKLVSVIPAGEVPKRINLLVAP